MSSTKPQDLGFSTDPTKLIKIINNSDVDVVVVIPSTADAPGGSGATDVYNQDLKILQTSSGKNSIAQGTSDTVTLDQYYKDPTTGQTKPALLYDLIISTANWISPVANDGVMKNIFATPPKFSDLTVTKDDRDAMKNAAQFHQTISAYPESQLAKNYQAAMSQTSSAASDKADGSDDSSSNVANSITDNVNAFFKSTKKYQNVTLAAIVAVQSYYQKFPFVWAEYNDSVTYYLYSSDGTATSFVGTVSLTNSGAIDLTKANGGYTVTFTPAKNPTDTTTVDVDSSKVKSLTYSDGLFLDDTSADIPGVALRGTFQLKSRFSQNPTDTQIISLLTGSVNGQTVLGIDSPQKSNDPSSSFWNTLFHPKNSEQIFQSVMQIGGALMMLHFLGSTLWGIYKWAKAKAGVKEPTTKELLEQQQKSFEEILKNNNEDLIKKLTDGKQELPSNGQNAIEQAANSEKLVSANADAARIEATLQTESARLETLAKFAPEMTAQQMGQLESAATNVQDIKTALDGADPSTIEDVVSTQKEALGNLRTSSEQLENDLGKTIGEQQKEILTEQKELGNKITEDMEKVDEQEAKGTGEEPAEGDEFPPDFPG